MAVNNLGTLSAKIVADTKGLTKGLKQGEKELKGFSSNVSKWLKPVSLAMVGIGVAVAAGIGLAVKHFATFEQSMKNVQAVSGATAKEFETLKDFAIEMGSKTVFTAKEAADAMYFLASAGLAVAEQMKTTSAVLDLAAATQTGLADSARIVVNTMSGFTLKADESRRIADVFAQSIATSQANMSKLGVAMPVVSATMDDLGISLETTVTGLSLLFDKGGRAETAATGLRNAMKRLIDPTDEAATEIERLGFTIGELDPRTNSLVDIIGKLEQASFDTASSIKLFGLENDAMNKLVSTGAEKFREFEKSLLAAAGAAETMKDVQLDSLAGDIKLLTSAVDGAVIAFGETFQGNIRSATSALTDMVTQWNNLGDTTKGMIAWTTALGGIGVGFIGAVGLAAIMVPKLIKAIKAFPIVLPIALAMADLALVISAVSKTIAAASDPMNDFKGQLIGLQTAQKGALEASQLIEKQLARLVSEGVDPATVSIGDLGINMGKLNRIYNNSGGLLDRFFRQITFSGEAIQATIRPTADATAVLRVLAGQLGRGADEGARLKGVLDGTITPLTAVEKAAKAKAEADEKAAAATKRHAAELVTLGSGLVRTIPIIRAYTTTIQRATEDGLEVWTDGAKDMLQTQIAFLIERERNERKAGKATEFIQHSALESAQKANDQAHLNELVGIRDTEDKKIKIKIDAQTVVTKIRDDDNFERDKFTQEEINQAARTGEVLVAIEEDRAARILAVQNTSWLDIANATAFGMDSLVDAWVFLSGNQDSFHETWLSQTADFVAGITDLLNDLTNAWTSAVTIINKIASFLPGGGGGGAGIAGAIGGGGGGAGLLGKVGGAASGIGAIGAKIGAGAKVAGAGIASGVGAGFAAIAPALPLLGPVGAFIGAALLINKFSSVPGSGNELTAEQRARRAAGARNRQFIESRAQERAMMNLGAFSGGGGGSSWLGGARTAGGRNISRILDTFNANNALMPGVRSGGGGTFGGGTGRIESLLSQILSALTSGASGGSRFSGFTEIGKSSQKFDSDLGSLGFSMSKVSKESFRLEDELAGHSLTTALALSAEEAKKMSAALTIAGKEFSNTKKEIDLLTLAEKNRAALLSSGLTSGKKNIDIQRKEFELQRDKKLAFDERQAAGVGSRSALLELAIREGNKFARAQLQVMDAERRQADRDNRDSEILQTIANKLDRLEAIERGIIVLNKDGVSFSRQDIGSALWELIAPSARAGGFV